MPTGSIGALRVTPTFAAQAILSPILLIGLGVFLWRSRTGLAIPRRGLQRRGGLDRRRAHAVDVGAVLGDRPGAAAFSVTLIIPTKGVLTPSRSDPSC